MSPAEIVEALPASRQIAARFARRFRLDLDDLISAATWATMRASQKHDPARGSFATFARAVVTNAMLDEVRRARRRTTLPLAEDVPDDRSSPEGSSPEDLDVFLDLTRGFDERTRTILWDRFVEGQTFAEIGGHLGVARSYVYALTKASLVRIRERLAATSA